MCLDAVGRKRTRNVSSYFPSGQGHVALRLFKASHSLTPHAYLVHKRHTSGQTCCCQQQTHTGLPHTWSLASNRKNRWPAENGLGKETTEEQGTAVTLKVTEPKRLFFSISGPTRCMSVLPLLFHLLAAPLPLHIVVLVLFRCLLLRFSLFELSRFSHGLRRFSLLRSWSL